MIKIEIRKGDITMLAVDAIVNAANNRMLMGGGVAGAIKRAGGKIIEDEAVKKGPIPIGAALATKAGNLNARYVIHAAVMGMDFQTDAEKIRKSTYNSLLQADELGIKSIAFPALGTGVGGFPFAECARIMQQEVMDYAKDKTSLEKVVFVLYDEPAYRIFKKEMESPER
ncbi:MAG: macro domain-containing protein [Dehalococcoidales bacterium]|nr:macro domain-containing protein [Dehalococcoidales bacterium]